MGRPPSGVSALTAGAFAILCVVTVIAGWVPAYVLLASGALAIGVVFNIWAARGSDRD